MQVHHRETGERLEISFRTLADRDAEGVIECIREEYGETYFKRDFIIRSSFGKNTGKESLRFSWR